MNLLRYIREVLRRRFSKDEYWVAYRSWKAAKPWNFEGPQRYPTREEIYDERLRRYEERRLQEQAHNQPPLA